MNQDQEAMTQNVTPNRAYIDELQEQIARLQKEIASLESLNTAMYTQVVVLEERLAALKEAA